MENKKYSLAEALKILTDFANLNNFDNLEVIKWIVIKTLRLKREQFDYIKCIELEELEKMKKYIKRYITGESLSRIFGYIEFCGELFDVTENVFDPRLSTEALVSEVLKYDYKNPEIIDLCTGSGCVAIILSKRLGVCVDALDVSPFAIEITEKNAKKLSGNICSIEFDLCDDWNKALYKKYDVIVSNPPYWNASKILTNPEVVNDNPLIAFNGGEDGLKFIKLIIKNSPMFLRSGGRLFLEMDPEQEKEIERLLLDGGFVDIKTAKDHRGIDRVISAKKE